mgnify:FL=1
MQMTQNKGSKIALAVAGLLLVAGAATAIAMTQSKTDEPAALFDTDDGAKNTGTMIPVPQAPSAETGEALDPEVPGMKGLNGSGSSNSPLDLMPQDEDSTTGDSSGSEAIPKAE